MLGYAQPTHMKKNCAGTPTCCATLVRVELVVDRHDNKPATGRGSTSAPHYSSIMQEHPVSPFRMTYFGTC